MELFNIFKGKQQNRRTDTRELEGMKRSEQRDVVPVKKMLKNSSPNEAGLYPHEVLLLSYAPTYYIDQKSYPTFWWSRYGVKNIDKLLKSLKKQGFLKVGSIESAISNETTENLEEVLYAKDLKVFGGKSDHVQRLMEELSAAQLDSLFPRRTYELTDLGKKVLAANGHIPYIHHHSILHLDIWSLDEKVKDNPGYAYRDIIWEYMNKKSLKYYKHSEFGKYRNCRFKMAEFLEEEGKDDSAFIYLAEVIRIDLSGVSNGFSMDYLETYAAAYFPYTKSRATVASHITEKIKAYQLKNALTDDALRTKLITPMNRLQLPFSIFTTEEAADIVVKEIRGEREGLKRLYHKAQERFDNDYGLA
ncbi:hypothetical protein SAMN04488102_10346 [Alkalibacterium subtropicum]|uniref:Uncharacterized protein n=1 Tax=Alkalibacterium subtropicum TaxID=753702 RepID=A0A1I1GEG5_9LACT|nr:hypothetical protein [Alkalibacterium subtropicum]SFC10167.1 hypothetical protein SAMN04488102_10346 [Alkalibacterium subtropicum]